MADEIKSVIIDIETKFNDRGIKDVTTGLEKSQRLADRLKKSFEDVNRVIGQASRNKIKLPGGDIELAELKDLRRALRLTAEEYENLNEEQKKTLDELISKNEKYISSLDKSTAANKKNVSSLEDHLKAINVLLPVLGRHGVAISLVVSNYLEYIKASKKGEAASTDFGKVLNVLRTNWGKLGATITATVGLGAADYFLNTAEGADKASEAMRVLELNGRSILRTFRLLFIDYEFKKGFEELSKVFRNEISEAAIELERNLKSLEAQIQKNLLLNAELNVSITKNEEILSDSVNSFNDIIKKEEAILRLSEDRSKRFKNDLDIAEKRFQQEVKLIATIRGLNENRLRFNTEVGVYDDISRQEAERLNKLYIELFNAQTRYNQVLDISNKETRRVNNEKRQLIDEYIEALQSISKAAKAIEIDDPLGVKKIDSDIDKLLAQDRIGEFVKNIEDAANRISKLVGRDISNLLPSELNTLENRFGLAPNTLFKINIDKNSILNDIQNVINEFNTRNTAKIEVEILPKRQNAQGLPDISNIIPGVTDFQRQEGISFFDRFFELDDEGKRKISEALEFTRGAIFDSLKAFQDAEVAKTEFLISEQERRLEETNRLAEFGNAEQLQLEKERLNDLLQAQQEAQEKQKAINALEIAANTALTASRFAGALTKDALTKDPLVAIASGFALLAAIGAGIAQLSAIQGFEDGTEYLTKGTKGKRGRTDVIPAYLAPGERIVPVNVNNQLNGIKNPDLPKFVNAGKLLLEGNLKLDDRKGGSQDSELADLLREQNRKLDDISNGISHQLVDINFDQNGFNIQQRRISRYAQKVNALRG